MFRFETDKTKESFSLQRRWIETGSQIIHGLSRWLKKETFGEGVSDTLCQGASVGLHGIQQAVSLWCDSAGRFLSMTGMEPPATVAANFIVPDAGAMQQERATAFVSHLCGFTEALFARERRLAKTYCLYGLAPLQGASGCPMV